MSSLLLYRIVPMVDIPLLCLLFAPCRAVLEPIKDVLTDLAQNGVPWVQRDARMTVHVINSLLHQ